MNYKVRLWRRVEKKFHLTAVAKTSLKMPWTCLNFSRCWRGDKWRFKATSGKINVYSMYIPGERKLFWELWTKNNRDERRKFCLQKLANGIMSTAEKFLQNSARKTSTFCFRWKLPIPMLHFIKKLPADNFHRVLFGGTAWNFLPRNTARLTLPHAKQRPAFVLRVQINFRKEWCLSIILMCYEAKVALRWKQRNFFSEGRWPRKKVINRSFFRVVWIFSSRKFSGINNSKFKTVVWKLTHQPIINN